VKTKHPSKPDVLLFLLSLSLLLPPMTALSQEEEKFLMVMKIEQEPLSPPDRTQFKVTNITTNLKDYQGKEIRYDLKNTIFWISNTSMYLNQPIQALDTSTPGVVKARNYAIEIDLYHLIFENGLPPRMPKESYEIELNTLENITTYRASTPLLIAGQEFIDDVNVTAVVYPNTTGTLELRQP
jgi:hypothetical protein